MRTSTSNILLLVLFFFTATACTQKDDMIELASIYNKAAQSYHDERDPVIIIPGILGSRLKDSRTDELVWGSFLGGFADPATAHGTRLLALPINERAELNDFSTSVIPDGVLGKIKLSVFGLPIELSAYYQVLKALGVGGFRDEELGESGVIDYGDNHFTCFQFAYDWRRDISANAETLHNFIKAKKEYVQQEYRKRYGRERDVKFTIVAHSMGGLLARYYMRYGPNALIANKPEPKLNWSGAQHVRKLILIGTPSGGSIQAFNDLLYGKDLGPVVPIYPASILGTMPAIYQLLARPRHKAYQLSSEDYLSDILDIKLWDKYNWGLLNPEEDMTLRYLLPEVKTQEERRKRALAYLGSVFRRTKRFQKMLDTPAHPPKGLGIYLFLSDSRPTASLAKINEDGEVTLDGFVPGDSLVPRTSVLMDERVGMKWHPRVESPIHWRSVTILPGDHIGLTMDPVFIDNILFNLLEEPSG